MTSLAPAVRSGVPLPWAFRDLKVGVVGAWAGCCQAIQQLEALRVPVAAVATHRSAQEEAESQELDGYRRLGLYDNLDRMAQGVGARFVRTPDLNAEGCVRALREAGVRLVLSVSAQLLQPTFLQAFDGFVFNIHGSAAYRGRAGLSWAILNGLRADRVVLHWVAPAIDAGQVVEEEPYEWPAECYPIDIMRVQFRAYGPLLKRFVAVLQSGRIPCRDPRNEAKLYFPLIRGERDGAVQWDWAPEAVAAFVRAFGWPYSGAYGYFRNSREMTTMVSVARCHVVDEGSRSFHPFCNGAPVRYGPDGSVDVVAGGGLLRLLTVRNGWDEAPAQAAVRLGGRFVGAPDALDHAGCEASGDPFMISR